MVSTFASHTPNNSDSPVNDPHLGEDAVQKGDNDSDGSDSDNVLDESNPIVPSQHVTGREVEGNGDSSSKRSLRKRTKERSHSSTASSAKGRKKNGEQQNSLTSDISKDSGKGRTVNHRSSSRKDESLLRDVYNDLRKVQGYLYTLCRPSYFFGKWPALIYVLWVIVSHAIMACRDRIRESMEPYCANKYCGNWIPLFCAVDTGDKPDGIAPNATGKLASSQDEVVVVLNSVGQNHQLARDMVGHEFALRDLRIRVAASKLNKKEEMTKDLKDLIEYTDEAADAVSAFTARFNKVTDKIIAIDEDAVDKLDAMLSTPNTLSRLRHGAYLILNPFSASMPTQNILTQQEFKTVLLTAAYQIASRLEPCTEQLREIQSLLGNIQANLGSIGQTTYSEKLDQHELNHLAAWWKQLARPDDYAKYKFHGVLLEDLGEIYETMGGRTADMISAIMRIRSDLDEFRDEFSSVSLVGRDESLEFVMSTLRQAGNRLVKARNNLEQTDRRQRRGVDQTVTVTAKIA